MIIRPSITGASDSYVWLWLWPNHTSDQHYQMRYQLWTWINTSGTTLSCRRSSYLPKIKLFEKSYMKLYPLETISKYAEWFKTRAVLSAEESNQLITFFSTVLSPLRSGTYLLFSRPSSLCHVFPYWKH